MMTVCVYILNVSALYSSNPLFLSIDAVLTLSLENAVYSADESDAAVEVCVVTLGGVANQTAYIILSTQSSTAVGMWL